MKTLLYVTLAIAALSTACKKDSKTFTPDCSGAAKSYSANVEPIIVASCASCHNEYLDYINVKNDSKAIRSTIIDGSMPEKETLSTEHKNTIVCWIDNGCLDN